MSERKSRVLGWLAGAGGLVVALGLAQGISRGCLATESGNTAAEAGGSVLKWVLIVAGALLALVLLLGGAIKLYFLSKKCPACGDRGRIDQISIGSLDKPAFVLQCMSCLWREDPRCVSAGHFEVARAWRVRKVKLEGDDLHPSETRVAASGRSFLVVEVELVDEVSFTATDVTVSDPQSRAHRMVGIGLEVSALRRLPGPGDSGFFEKGTEGDAYQSDDGRSLTIGAGNSFYSPTRGIDLHLDGPAGGKFLFVFDVPTHASELTLAGAPLPTPEQDEPALAARPGHTRKEAVKGGPPVTLDN